MADVTAREEAVRQREDAIGATEAQVASTTIGPGTHIVRQELARGRYRSDGSAGMCHAKQTRDEGIV